MNVFFKVVMLSVGFLVSFGFASAVHAQDADAVKKAQKEKDRICGKYLENMDAQLRQLDTKDLIRYSAQMANFDAWKWPYFAKRCSADKYTQVLDKHQYTMNKIHSKYR